ncbi:hypothetical protein F5Y19DRAFT_493287 [Xylariaceae sp. FL1651]|nr:hypothetical protein F5Y19DRAFT_493287 [Xylariaceae sp. FL1651]
MMEDDPFFSDGEDMGPLPLRPKETETTEKIGETEAAEVTKATKATNAMTIIPQNTDAALGYPYARVQMANASSAVKMVQEANQIKPNEEIFVTTSRVPNQVVQAQMVPRSLRCPRVIGGLEHPTVRAVTASGSTTVGEDSGSGPATGIGGSRHYSGRDGQGSRREHGVGSALFRSSQDDLDRELRDLEATENVQPSQVVLAQANLALALTRKMIADVRGKHREPEVDEDLG